MAEIHRPVAACSRAEFGTGGSSSTAIARSSSVVGACGRDPATMAVPVARKLLIWGEHGFPDS